MKRWWTELRHELWKMRLLLKLLFGKSVLPRTMIHPEIGAKNAIGNEFPNRE